MRIKASFRTVQPMPTDAEIEAAFKAAIVWYGDKVLRVFKNDVMANALGLAPKAFGKGAPLVKTGRYIRSWKATVSGNRRLSFAPTGNNENMSNEQLAELLEYGNGNIPARPHIRILLARVRAEGPKAVGQRIIYELSRRS